MTPDSVYCAIDLGATSGRIIISRDGKELIETHRFPNQIYEREGKYYWDTDALFAHIRKGLSTLAARTDIRVQSIGVDTWGVDVVFIGKDGKALAHPRAYRDPYTTGIIDQFAHRIPREVIYEKTGIQFLDFNTIYQLYACHLEHYAPFEQAAKYLFIPDYIAYLLTGQMVCEYTILSTSQLLNARTRQLDNDLVEATGADITKFAPLIYPGSRIGYVKREVIDFAYDVPVIAVASHDTASAVATVPQGHVAYLSSGTWSLMGIVTPEPVIQPQALAYNFTNEGGVDGSIRLLKNITGMWIIEQCRKQWLNEGKHYTYPQMEQMAREADQQGLPHRLFNPDEPRFANPRSMLDEVCQGEALSDGQIMALVYHSMANRYKQVFDMLQALAPYPIETLYVLGGGANNTYLMELTQQALGIPVMKGAQEATAEGNIRIQQNYYKS